MTHVAVDPTQLFVLSVALTRQAAEAEALGDEVELALRGSGLGSLTPALLSEQARTWRHVASALADRAALAMGLVFDLAPAPPTPRPPDHPYATGIIDLLRASGPTSGRPFPSIASYRRFVEHLTSWLGELEDRQLRDLMTALTVDQRLVLVRALAPDDPQLQRLVDALPSSPAGDQGRSSLRAIAEILPIVELAAGRPPRGTLSYADLGAALDNEGLQLPPWMARRVRALFEQPVWFTNIARAGVGRLTATRRGEGELTAETIEQAVAEIAAVEMLTDRNVFDRLDAFTRGDADGFVSRRDIEAALASGSFDANQRHLLAALLTGQGTPEALVWRSPWNSFSALEAARPSTRDEGGDRDGLLSYDDVVAAVVNLHVFADDPTGARRFVGSLEATFDDMSGRTPGLEIRAHSDDGVRALAAAALSASGTFAEQVAVVSRLPESRGGVRNLLYTLYYAEGSARMDHLLNGHLAEPTDPTTPGHSGAHWLMFAPFASESIRSALVGNQPIELPLLPDPGVGWSERQNLADGNQQIFGDIVPRFAAFLAAFEPGRAPTEAELKEFLLDTPDPTDSTRPLFRPGHQQLRTGFVALAAALDPGLPPKLRQELTFLSNTLVATHEQAAAQDVLRRLVHQSFGEDRAWQALGALVGPAVGLSQETMAADAMRYRIGRGRHGRVFPVARDLEPARATDNNLLLGTDLTERLNPDRYNRVTIGDTTVSWVGDDRYDLALPDMGGWNAPPAGSGMGRFPTDTRTWFDDGTDGAISFPLLTPEFSGPAPTLREARGDTLGTNLTGTGAYDWSDPADRQWYIQNLFHQLHTDPFLWLVRPELGLARTDGGRPSYDWLPSTARRQLD